MCLKCTDSVGKKIIANIGTFEQSTSKLAVNTRIRQTAAVNQTQHFQFGSAKRTTRNHWLSVTSAMTTREILHPVACFRVQLTQWVAMLRKEAHSEFICAFLLNFNRHSFHLNFNSSAHIFCCNVFTIGKVQIHRQLSYCQIGYLRNFDKALQFCATKNASQSYFITWISQNTFFFCAKSSLNQFIISCK